MRRMNRGPFRLAAYAAGLALGGGLIGVAGASETATATDTAQTPSTIACRYENAKAFSNPASTAWRVTSSEVVTDASGRTAHAWAGYATHQAIAERAGATSIGYFDQDRILTVATRGAGDPAWTIRSLGARLEHDSHSNVTLAFDTDGNLHVAARTTYSDKLRYWVTTSPGDLGTLTAASMIPSWKDNGRPFEDWVSYPELYTGVDGKLFFRYAHGQPGASYTIVYQFDVAKKHWQLSDPGTGYHGLAKVWAGWYTDPTWSVYPTVPLKGPDGRYHMIWTWRGDGSANSNSQVAYAVSDDLHVWKNVSGDVVSDTSFTYPDRRLVVDDVPKGGGLLNGSGMALGFDAEGRPVISYFKYSGTGPDATTQLYAARPSGATTGDGWTITQVSAWTGRYDLARNALDAGVLNANTGARQIGAYLAIPYLCQQRGHTLYVDAATGKRVADVPATSDTALPEQVQQSAFAPGYFLWPQTVSTPQSTATSTRLLKSEAGPWVVNGDTVPHWSYPVGGSPLTVFTLVR